MISFNCYESTKDDCLLTVGKKYVLCEDVLYCSLNDVVDVDTAEWLSKFTVLKGGYVYLEAGIVLEFKGFADNHWPTFIIADDELDLCADTDIQLIELK